jgi:hypothetical protein
VLPQVDSAGDGPSGRGPDTGTTQSGSRLPDGVIGDAYYASEWLDCDCHTHSPERDAATALEITLRTSEPLDIDPGLLQTLAATWF